MFPHSYSHMGEVAFGPSDQFWHVVFSTRAGTDVNQFPGLIMMPFLELLFSRVVLSLSHVTGFGR